MIDPKQRILPFDTSVSLGLILALVGNLLYSGYFFGSLNQRVDALEKSAVIANAIGPAHAERLTRLEAAFSAAQRDLSEIKTDLKQLLNRQPASK